MTLRRLLKLPETGIEWLHSKVSKKQFLIIASILVGLSAGLAAVLLKLLVHYIKFLVTTDYGWQYQYIFYLAFPAIGIALTVVIVKTVLKGKLRRGSAAILHSIARKNSKIPAD